MTVECTLWGDCADCLLKNAEGARWDVGSDIADVDDVVSVRLLKLLVDIFL